MELDSRAMNGNTSRDKEHAAGAPNTKPLQQESLQILSLIKKGLMQQLITIGIGADSVPEFVEKFNIDLEDYLKVKGLLYIERIKDLIGGIMALCGEDAKYQIMESIMHQSVFH